MWILILLFTSCESISPSLMCESTDNQDCSPQLPESDKNECVVINNSPGCLTNEFEFTKPVQRLSSESEAEFSISIHSYSATFEKFLNVPLSAINIRFTVLHKDIKGFSLIIKQDWLNITLCRIMDFRNYSKEIIIPTTLFYDCFYYLVESNIQHVYMAFTSMPMNQELSYYVFIPPAMTHDSGCSWQALIMVFCKSLSKGIVMVKFSQAPTSLNVTYYSVQLVEKMTDKVIHTLYKASNYKKYMLHAEFSSIEAASYFVVVQAENTHCLPAKTAAFLVSNKAVNNSLILYICIAVLLIVSVLSFVKCLQMYKHSEFPRKQVLLVYSYDSPEHEEFISSFGSYLKNECRVNVSTIYGKTEKKSHDTQRQSKDPNQCIRDKYKEADVVVFLISEGLFLTLHKGIQLKEGSPWRQQLLRTVAYISLQIFNSQNSSMKKFCKIYFSYSDKKHIPPSIQDLGRCYQLPQEFNKFLCFIFNTKSFMKCLPGSCPQSNTRGREMLQGVKTVQRAAKNIESLNKVEQSTNTSIVRYKYKLVNSDVNGTSQTLDEDSDPIFKEWEDYLREVYNSNRQDSNVIENSQNLAEDPILREWEDYLREVHSSN